MEVVQSAATNAQLWAHLTGNAAGSSSESVGGDGRGDAGSTVGGGTNSGSGAGDKGDEVVQHAAMGVSGSGSEDIPPQLEPQLKQFEQSRTSQQLLPGQEAGEGGVPWIGRLRLHTPSSSKQRAGTGRATARRTLSQSSGSHTNATSAPAEADQQFVLVDVHFPELGKSDMQRLGLVQDLVWSPVQSSAHSLNSSTSSTDSRPHTSPSLLHFNPVRAAAEDWPSELAHVAVTCGAEVVVEHGSLMVATCVQV